jgi:phosphoserine phosphatase
MLIFHTQHLNAGDLKLCHDIIGIKPEPYKNHYRATVSPDYQTIRSLSDALKIDVNMMPSDFKSDAARLILSDMDSTLISIECIDEIADFANIKPEVSAITEAAMLGELDFSESLQSRVTLLKGLNTDVLDRVYQDRLRLNPGAENLIKTSRDMGVKFALVSGGFTYFTDKLKTCLKLDFTRANTLTIDGSTLTGTVTGEIIDAGVKAEFLKELCANLGITPQQTIAMGDGANDLKMMQLAGLGVAYRSKPLVQEQVDARLNYSSLDAVLDFLQ